MVFKKKKQKNGGLPAYKLLTLFSLFVKILQIYYFENLKEFFDFLVKPS
jgi:hypothetical protein